MKLLFLLTLSIFYMSCAMAQIVLNEDEHELKMRREVNRMNHGDSSFQSSRNQFVNVERNTRVDTNAHYTNYSVEDDIHLYILSISRITQQLQRIGLLKNVVLTIKPETLSPAESIAFNREVAHITSILHQLFNEHLAQQIELNYVIFEQIITHTNVIKNRHAAPEIESWQMPNELDYYRSNAFERSMHYCDQLILSNLDELSKTESNLATFITSTTLVLNSLRSMQSSSPQLLEQQISLAVTALSEVSDRLENWIYMCTSNDFIRKRFNKLDDNQEKTQQLLLSLCTATRECEFPLVEK